jgi:hypothetical protein
MKKLIALLLLCAGVVVAALGYRRSESVAGVSDAVGTKIANTWDGKVRQPDHVWYYAAAGVLMLTGGVLWFRRG